MEGYKYDHMHKTSILKNFGSFAAIILFIISAVSCEKTEYDLLDPDDAGVWTLFNTADGLPGNTVSDIQLDRRGNLWLTFPGQGCAKYVDGTWTSYVNTNSPLLNNIVSCLAESADDGVGRLRSAGRDAVRVCQRNEHGR